MDAVNGNAPGRVVQGTGNCTGVLFGLLQDPKPGTPSCEAARAAASRRWIPRVPAAHADRGPVGPGDPREHDRPVVAPRPRRAVRDAR